MLNPLRRNSARNPASQPSLEIDSPPRVNPVANRDAPPLIAQTREILHSAGPRLSLPLSITRVRNSRCHEIATSGIMTGINRGARKTKHCTQNRTERCFLAFSSSPLPFESKLRCLCYYTHHRRAVISLSSVTSKTALVFH